MAITPLPDSPDLGQLKKRAKALLKSVRAGDTRALERVGPYFGDPAQITLQQAQLVIARGHGFSSWTRLKRHIESVTDEGGDQLASRFLDLVTVAYGPVPDFGPARFEQAQALLTAHPGIRQHSIYTAAAIGDVAEIDRWLARDPGLLDRKGGYFDWPPLMYAAYARLPGASTLAAGRHLLARGADPNPYYMWGGQYKFTALTGVFGQGEGGPLNQPAHPDYVEFARALLDHGANPNDSQAAYNRCFEPGDKWLEVLLDYGLAPGDKNNWLLVEGDRRMPHPSETLYFQLIQAIKRGYGERVALLIQHGVDLTKPDDTYDTRTKGRTPYQVALLMGEEEIARMLAKAGADQGELPPDLAFQVAAMAGDEAAARTALGQMQGLPEAATQAGMLRDAARRGRVAALRAMIALGFDVNAADGATALHEAALGGDEAAARVLLSAGANPTLRDSHHHATPMGWALHGEQAGMVALLDRQKMDIFTAAMRGNLDQVTARLAEDPGRINQRFADLCGGTEPPENGWTTPLVFAVAAGQVPVVRALLAQGADPLVKSGTGQSVLSVARDEGGAAVLAEVEQALAARG